MEIEGNRISKLIVPTGSLTVRSDGGQLVAASQYGPWRLPFAKARRHVRDVFGRAAERGEIAPEAGMSFGAEAGPAILLLRWTSASARHRRRSGETRRRRRQAHCTFQSQVWARSRNSTLPVATWAAGQCAVRCQFTHCQPHWWTVRDLCLSKHVCQALWFRVAARNQG